MIKKEYFIIQFIVLSFILASCTHKCNTDELWREKVTLSDDTHIFIYHSSKCTKKQPFTSVTEKIIDFKKFKFDVFDICITEQDADMLNQISKRNVSDYVDNALIFAEDKTDYELYKTTIDIIDITKRKYKVYWATNDNGGLIKLKSPISTYDFKYE